MTKKDLTENSKTSSEIQPRLADGRRKFLKGTSLALPAVMTLHIQSVSAVALDTFNRCVTGLSTQSFPGVIDYEDGCSRKIVKCYTDAATSQKILFVDDSTGPVRVIPYVDGHDTYIDISAVPDGPWVECGDNKTYYAVIRFDLATGMEKSLGVEGYGYDEGTLDTAGIAMSAGGACWHSAFGGGLG